MKSGSVKKLVQVIVLGTSLSPWAVIFAAQQEVIWGKVENYIPLLKGFSLVQSPSVPQGLRMPVNFNKQQHSVNTLKYVSGTVDQTQKSHVRYNQYFQGLPVWGTQVIYHVSSGKTMVTGTVVNEIEKDIIDLEGKITPEQAKDIVLGKQDGSTKVQIEKIIYFDSDLSNKAMLAYHLSYLATSKKGPAIPSFIIDANTGKILKKWNALRTVEAGQGPGGVNVEGRMLYNVSST